MIEKLNILLMIFKVIYSFSLIRANKKTCQKREIHLFRELVFGGKSTLQFSHCLKKIKVPALSFNLFLNLKT